MINLSTPGCRFIGYALQIDEMLTVRSPHYSLVLSYNAFGEIVGASGVANYLKSKPYHYFS